MLPQLLGTESGIVATPDVGIVIDTLRFTTTACQALVNAKSLTVASEIAEARAVKQASTESARELPLLCGERNCAPIEGFDLGNSPLEYEAAHVRDRRLIFTTTNGTRAVKAIEQAQQIWLGAFVNRHAIVGEILRLRPTQVVIVCSGTEGVIAQEDSLAAGAIAAGLASDETLELNLNDSALLCQQAWEGVIRSDRSLSQVLREGVGGRNLITAGYEADLDFSARIDSIDVLPRNFGTKQTFVRDP